MAGVYLVTYRRSSSWRSNRDISVNHRQKHDRTSSPMSSPEAKKLMKSDGVRVSQR
jgi:hypothetical protein